MANEKKAVVLKILFPCCRRVSERKKSVYRWRTGQTDEYNTYVDRSCTDSYYIFLSTDSVKLHLPIVKILMKPSAPRRFYLPRDDPIWSSRRSECNSARKYNNNDDDKPTRGVKKNLRHLDAEKKNDGHDINPNERLCWLFHGGPFLSNLSTGTRRFFDICLMIYT